MAIERVPQPLEYAPRPPKRSNMGLVFLLPVLTLAIPLLLLNRTTDCSLSRKTVCQGNLRGVFSGLYAYCDRNEGAIPENWLNAILSENEITPKMLICPEAGSGKNSYYYVPIQKLYDSPGHIVMYEDPSNHAGSGGHVVYSNFDIQWIPAPQYSSVIDSISFPEGTSWHPHR